MARTNISPRPRPALSRPDLPAADRTATAAGSRQPKVPRYPRHAAAPVLVEARRGAIVESRHRGHVVQVDGNGRIERGVGDPDLVANLRSAVKPFALLPVVESGAAEAFRLSDQELAVMAASHSGEDAHVRTLQAVLRRANLSQAVLACGSEGAPLDSLTAARLARDGETPGPLRHMCSGFHVGSMLLARHAGWPISEYWQADHPSQLAARDAVTRVFGVAPASLRTAVDACGVLTYAFPLADIARAFALLAAPDQAPDLPRRSLAPALMRIRDAMMAAPDMVGGTRDALDTALMKARPGAIVSKSGAEGLRAIGLLPGALGRGSAAAGVAIKIEDGDHSGRANRAVSVESLALLGALSRAQLEALADYHRPLARDPRGQVVGEARASFDLAPMSEFA